MQALWTIGHSTRSLDELVAALEAHGIGCLADVRRFPGSRRHPQFSQASLERELPAAGIAYTWIAELGGRRRPVDPDAPSAWRNPSFAAYGQHVATEEFARGLDTLLHLAHATPTAVMCSELLWWRCHRALIADAVLAAGWPVTHIFDAASSKPHTFTSPARLACGCLTYEPA